MTQQALSSSVRPWKLTHTEDNSSVENFHFCGVIRLSDPTIGWIRRAEDWSEKSNDLFVTSILPLVSHQLVCDLLFRLKIL